MRSRLWRLYTRLCLVVLCVLFLLSGPFQDQHIQHLPECSPACSEDVLSRINVNIAEYENNLTAVVGLESRRDDYEVGGLEYMPPIETLTDRASDIDSLTSTTPTVPKPPQNSDNGDKYTGTYSVHRCPGLLPPRSRAEEVFQEVSPGRSYVYSAYYDGRVDPGVVRVIGVSDFRQDGRPLWCHLWYDGQTDAEVVSVMDDIVPETHDTRFVFSLYTCPSRTTKVPYSVSLTRHRCQSAVNLLTVQGPANSNPTNNITVCVAPLHLRYNNIQQLTEMIEVNRIFGADKFIFYNFSIGPDVDTYLLDYIKFGIAEVVQWPLPVAKHGLLWDVYYFGQLGAQLDCFYRSLHNAKYVAFLDLDETIVPRTGQKWSDTFEKGSDMPVCAFSYRNVFFSLDLPSDVQMIHSPAEGDYQIQTLLKTTREKYIWPHGFRSKYIADIRYLEMPGIHAPWKCLAKDTVYHVSSAKALLHHYRSWGMAGSSNLTTDKTLYKWRSIILKNIINMHTRHNRRKSTRLE